GWIQDRANALLRTNNGEVRRISDGEALGAARHDDFVAGYVDDLTNALDLDAIRSAGVRCAVDPLGGASVAYWQAIASRFALDLTVVNPTIDPRFAFMTL